MNRSRINEAWIKVLLFPTYCIEGEDHLIHKQRAYLDLILKKIIMYITYRQCGAPKEYIFLKSIAGSPISKSDLTNSGE